MNSLTRLSANGIVSAKTTLPLLQDAKRRSLKTNGISQDKLPVPHPVDFDWRFAPTATRALSRISQSLGKRIACLGTPSVFANLNKSRSSSNSHYFDRCDASINFFKSIGLLNVDRLDCFRDFPPSSQFDVIVMDPPWYEDEYKAFMWMASQLVHVNGFVVLVLPPLGTRPNVTLERSCVLEWGERLGMNLVHLSEGCLPYMTPHFELNSLHNAGIYCELGSWRRGTLAVFEIQQRRRVSRPPNTSKCEWDEAVCLGTRFRFKRRRAFGLVDLRLDTIVKGDVLSSVSRTDPVRPAVDVWTSGNRVFGCEGPTQLYKLFSRLISSPRRASVDLSEGGPHHEFEAVRQLVSLAKHEKLERDRGCYTPCIVS
ncbi:hypothetical protein [Stieleria tagensis]|uniref:hypothetical protein n=1 Tax=Stieleria tagensis TaxID=2956795 RepID=UPI0036F2436A